MSKLLSALEVLNRDIFEHVAVDLSVRGILAMCSTCTYLRSLSTNELWVMLAVRWYGYHFWLRAFARRCRPAFAGMKSELSKIERFQNVHTKKVDQR